LTVVEKKSSAQIIQRKLLDAGRPGLGEIMRGLKRTFTGGSSVEIQSLQTGTVWAGYGIMWKKFLTLLPVLLLTGCAATFTRMTPLQQSRNANSLYPVEVIFNTQQQSLRWDSVQPYVLVGGELYKMRPVPMMPNRWEGLVPVPAGANGVDYRFKFDYLYNNFGTEPKPNSAFSPMYRLKIVEP
jgi:hypothetical protein